MDIKEIDYKLRDRYQNNKNWFNRFIMNQFQNLFCFKELEDFRIKYDTRFIKDESYKVKSYN